MLTTFGIVVLILLVLFSFLPYKYSVALLIVLCAFSATGFMRISGKFIQPYLIGSVYVVVRTLFAGHNNFIVNGFTQKLVLFAFVSILITYCCPQLFDGITIYEKNLDYSWAKGGMPLHFGLNNITQMGYTVLNIATLGCIYVMRGKIGNTILRDSFLVAVVIVVVLGYWEFLAKTIGIVQFPSSLFLNSEEIYEAVAVGGNMRMSSVFAEASFCGAFLAASFWGVFMLNTSIKWKYLLLMAIGVAMVFNLSGTGFVSFVVGAVVYFLLNENKWRNMFVLLLLCILVFLLLHIMGYGDFVYETIFGKSSSDSGIVRKSSVENSWNVFIETYMIGAGMGSTRSSSFLFDMLAQVGLIGSILFASVYYDLIKRLRTKISGMYIYFYLLTMLVAQVIAISDFSFSAFWMGLYLAAGYNEKEHIIKNKLICKYHDSN